MSRAICSPGLLAKKVCSITWTNGNTNGWHDYQKDKHAKVASVTTGLFCQKDDQGKEYAVYNYQLILGFPLTWKLMTEKYMIVLIIWFPIHRFWKVLNWCRCLRLLISIYQKIKEELEHWGDIMWRLFDKD